MKIFSIRISFFIRNLTHWGFVLVKKRCKKFISPLSRVSVFILVELGESKPLQTHHLCHQPPGARAQGQWGAYLQPGHRQW